MQLGQKRLLARIRCAVEHSRLVNGPQTLDIDVVNVAIFRIELRGNYVSFVHLQCRARRRQSAEARERGMWRGERPRRRTGKLTRQEKHRKKRRVKGEAQRVSRWLTKVAAIPLLRGKSKTKTGERNLVFARVAQQGGGFESANSEPHFIQDFDKIGICLPARGLVLHTRSVLREVHAFHAPGMNLHILGGNQIAKHL